jgi:hypothetical protein
VRTPEACWDVAESSTPVLLILFFPGIREERVPLISCHRSAVS